MGEMAYLYHFCVSHQTTPGVVVYSDGTISRDAAIDSHEAYNSAKTCIAEFAEFPKTEMVVLSLTTLKATP